ncbi:MAG: hypothetical protein LAQ69_46095 [Acidobacteriia bacterium]|nr:hypothetical protein [Terriglobia bacterium]
MTDQKRTAGPKIKVPQHLNTLTFERLLLAHYDYTLSPQEQPLVFDLSQLRLCDPFPISLLVIWLNQLSELGLKIHVVPPDPSSPTPVDLKQEVPRATVLPTLSAWCFFAFLLDKGISITGDVSLARAVRAPDHYLSPLLFVGSSLDFDTLLKQTQGQPEIHFGPVIDEQVIRGGAIKNVVLRELGDNLFDHAGGRFAHLLMSRGSPPTGTDLDRENIIAARIAAAPAAEQSFFRSLRSRGYVAVLCRMRVPACDLNSKSRGAQCQARHQRKSWLH